jgi:hypothetical protein
VRFLTRLRGRCPVGADGATRVNHQSRDGQLVLRVVGGMSPRRVKHVGVPHLARKRACLPRKREKKARWNPSYRVCASLPVYGEGAP